MSPYEEKARLLGINRGALADGFGDGLPFSIANMTPAAYVPASKRINRESLGILADDLTHLNPKNSAPCSERARAAKLNGRKRGS